VYNNYQLAKTFTDQRLAALVPLSTTLRPVLEAKARAAERVLKFSMIYFLFKSLFVSALRHCLADVENYTDLLFCRQQLF
jgi:hypothetical protein